MSLRRIPTSGPIATRGPCAPALGRARTPRASSVSHRSASRCCAVAGQVQCQDHHNIDPKLRPGEVVRTVDLGTSITQLGELYSADNIPSPYSEIGYIFVSTSPFCSLKI